MSEHLGAYSAAILSFLIGAAIGSFINVIALRYNTDKGWLWNRSRCPHCHTQLRWWELMPIISYIALKGKCSYCKKSISPRYIAVEVLCGALAVAATMPLPSTAEEAALRACVAGATYVLVLLALIDLKTFLLPDQYILLLSLFAGATILLQPDKWNLATLWGAIVGSGFLLLLWAVTGGRGLGLGDVKLMLPVGALVGLTGVAVLFFIAFCVGGIVGLVLLARGRATMKTAIPFGPFLAGAAIVLLLAPQLVEKFFLSLLRA